MQKVVEQIPGQPDQAKLLPLEDPKPVQVRRQSFTDEAMLPLEANNSLIDTTSAARKGCSITWSS